MSPYRQQDLKCKDKILNKNVLHLSFFNGIDINVILLFKYTNVKHITACNNF